LPSAIAPAPANPLPYDLHRMTSTAIDQEPGSDDSPAVAARRRLGLRWWKELLYVAAFYGIYSIVRNTFGSAGSTSQLASETAYGHALDVIKIERFFHLFVEPPLQSWYLSLPGNGLIRGWNIYYGTAHFVVTIVALVVLFRRDPTRYPTWRNTLAIMTAIALVGFASFSLMPPRLLDNTSEYGACFHRQPACHHFDLNDTLESYGGLWSFDSGAMSKVSNQYAAMPSLHTGWSTWCAFVLVPMIRRRRWKILMAMYPVATVFGIMITGNHYWLDAIGGLIVFGVGYLLGSWLAAFNERRREARLAMAPTA